MPNYNSAFCLGVTVLGTPAEIYNFGTQYWMIVGAILGSGIIVATVYLPVFSKLKLQSSYEYLELRFDKSLRTMASIMFLIDEILFLPVLVYVPALAFNQVTGINIHVIGSAVCLVCIFYTVLGGLRAVIWTDTWQVGVMFGSVLLVAILGTIQAGGLNNILEAASEGERLEFFNWDTNLYHRHTVWGTLFGGCLYWTAFNSVNQTMVQRYMALPSQKSAVMAIGLFSVGAVCVVSLCCYCGLLIFERFGACDPRAAGLLQADDQLLPAYVALSASNLPGVIGIFVAGVFGAALSSMSVVLNSSATVVLEDIIRGLFGRRPNSKYATLIARGTAAILGVSSLGALFLIERLSGVLSVATSLSAIAASSTFGMFTLGMLWPWATPRGALAGAIVGALTGGWAALGSQTAAAQGLVPPDRRPPSLAGCTDIFNATNIWPDIPMALDPETVFPLYRISYHWIAPIGLITTLVVGVIVSALTRNHDAVSSLDPDLLSPIIYRFLPEGIMNNAGISTRNRRSIRNEIAAPTIGGITPSTTFSLLLADQVKIPQKNGQRHSQII
ncbi:sodium/solute co-transporter-like 5A11 isoform X2 [Arctopsyche grandis]|uniref:sodium/solute co-transporter-like 5A11 isoform X2 n=1 Tax=Arctopsyche grandis TaxID=121162 RepID=UPI00406D69F6